MRCFPSIGEEGGGEFETDMFFVFEKIGRKCCTPHSRLKSWLSRPFVGAPLRIYVSILAWVLELCRWKEAAGLSCGKRRVRLRRSKLPSNRRQHSSGRLPLVACSIEARCASCVQCSGGGRPPFSPCQCALISLAVPDSRLSFRRVPDELRRVCGRR